MASKPLPAWDSESGLLHVIVDTPKGSPTKFKHDAKKDMFTISHVLPPGAAFPFDFGSIPSTAAEDGDPLDVLVLLENPTFPGCLTLVRIVGVLDPKSKGNAAPGGRTCAMMNMSFFASCLNFVALPFGVSTMTWSRPDSESQAGRGLLAMRRDDADLVPADNSVILRSEATKDPGLDCVYG